MAARPIGGPIFEKIPTEEIDTDIRSEEQYMNWLGSELQTILDEDFSTDMGFIVTVYRKDAASESCLTTSNADSREQFMDAYVPVLEEMLKEVLNQKCKK